MPLQDCVKPVIFKNLNIYQHPVSVPGVYNEQLPNDSKNISNLNKQNYANLINQVQKSKNATGFIKEVYDSFGLSKDKSNCTSNSTYKSQQSFEVGVVLFKIHDLRTRDHESILIANQNCAHVLYIFVLED